MIKSFKCQETARIFNRQVSKHFPQSIQKRAYMRLNQLNSVIAIEELRLPPSNRLEKLLGNREGQYSIRINNQWRLCFIWENKAAYDVEIVDYH